jgi:lysozyme
MNIYDVLRFEEGFRADPYLCSEGYVTVGVGTKLHTYKGLDPSSFCISVSETQADEWVKRELSTQSFSLSKQPSYSLLSDDRKAIIQSMAYQMGITGLFNFKKMWAALDAGNYGDAADEMLDSRWAAQTPERAVRHARVIRWGSLYDAYREVLG